MQAYKTYSDSGCGEISGFLRGVVPSMETLFVEDWERMLSDIHICGAAAIADTLLFLTKDLLLLMPRF